MWAAGYNDRFGPRERCDATTYEAAKEWLLDEIDQRMICLDMSRDTEYLGHELGELEHLYRYVKSLDDQVGDVSEAGCLIFWLAPVEVRPDATPSELALESAELISFGVPPVSAAKAKRRPMTEAERARRDEERRAKLEAAHDLLFAKINDLTSSDEWLTMLRTAAKFHSYSWRNCLMILAQCPGATRVAGYKTWQNLDRQVRKGEPGIKIWAGFEYTAEDEDHPDDDGQPRKVKRTGYRIEHVWDISQTDGEELPQVSPQLLTGEAPERLWEALAAQIAIMGYELRREAVPGLSDANGAVIGAERIVRVRPDLAGAAAVKTLAHELGHIRCGHAEGSCTDPRSQREVEAESVAFLVCDAFGLDTSGYTIAYVAGWAPEGKELETVSMTADVVVRAAREILDGTDEWAGGSPDPETGSATAVRDEPYRDRTMRTDAA